MLQCILFLFHRICETRQTGSLKSAPILIGFIHEMIVHKAASKKGHYFINTNAHLSNSNLCLSLRHAGVGIGNAWNSLIPLSLKSNIKIVVNALISKIFAFKAIRNVMFVIWKDACFSYLYRTNVNAYSNYRAKTKVCYSDKIDKWRFCCKLRCRKKKYALTPMFSRLFALFQ